ncbi:MAG: hypothetical protein NTX72_05020 [Candidatus Uhrbacteria bacterium]|nr:hypothetical protein [Candidatus Uhrbacteria bacterium]
MLKKILILSLVLAAGICPFLPKVFADNASWKTLLADRVWDQTTFRVDRLTYPANVSNPMKRNGIAFVSTPSTQCADLGLCDKIDLSILKDGKSQTVNGVDQSFLNPSFAIAQKGKFVYFTKSTTKDNWFDVSFVDPNTGEIHPFTSLARKPNEVSFVSFSTSGDRLYTSLLQMNPTTKQVQSSIVAKSTDGKYEQRDIAFMLNAPWQQVEDAYNDQLLVKFQFSGGNKQLWVINAATQQMYAIPNTWIDPQADFFYPHFLTNGTIVFFQNYQMFTFNPATQTVAPVAHATLNWKLPIEDAVTVKGDTMAWVDDTNKIWYSLPDGTVKPALEMIGEKVATALNQNPQLLNQISSDPFITMDTLGTLRVGEGAKQQIWFKNGTDKAFVIGTGSHPILTDATHVIWKGTDGALYQATFSSILSMHKTNTVFDGGFVPGQRVKAVGDARVYLIGNDGQLHWITSETVAYSVFGTSWNKGITEVSPTFLWRFANGTNVDSDQTVKSL